MISVTGGPACQSCGAPMMGAKDHGGGKESNIYCRYCCDKNGVLLPYLEVHKNMVTERFIKVNGMEKSKAEDAAHRALAQMPAWRGGRK